MKKTVLRNILTAIALCTFAQQGLAQLNTMGSMYYQNPYLANPAMAGTERGWEINGAYKAQWTAVEGAPAMQALTAAYGTSSSRVGLGLSLFNESAGILRRTALRATYAYHLPLNSGDEHLDFGISGGVTNEWIDFNKVRGDLSEQSLYAFNDRKPYFDGDFGAAFRGRHLTVQAALPNLKRLFSDSGQPQVADRSSYMASAGYRFTYLNGSALSSLEPKLTYRGVEQFKDLFDAGVNAEFFGNRFLASCIYHSTGSVTAGVGTNYKNQLGILCQYTTNTTDLQSYSNGEFEIGIRFSVR